MRSGKIPRVPAFFSTTGIPKKGGAKRKEVLPQRRVTPPPPPAIFDVREREREIEKKSSNSGWLASRRGEGGLRGPSSKPREVGPEAARLGVSCVVCVCAVRKVYKREGKKKQ